MHEPYENRLNHSADFRVKYKFRNPEEGGRKTGTPYQGVRCDFSIVGEPDNKQFMIWPEFEDRTGNIIKYNDNHVPVEGTARMWVINPEMRPLYYDRIKIGMKCNFREGLIYSADCEVIEILSLKTNPTKNK